MTHGCCANPHLRGTPPLRMGLDQELAALPSLGWVQAPSPVLALTALGRHLGIEDLSVKRDDLLQALHGGNKARKLDTLLATEPFRDAPVLASIGAIGSGHLAACTAAVQTLGRRLDAYTFFEPLSAGVLENLAFVASGPTRMTYFGSRLELGLRRPMLVSSKVVDGAPMIPPGGTLPAAVAGVARAGLELATQIAAGVLEPPDVVYVALGTGGTAAGLALGLGLAGVACEVRAVATVERLFISGRRVRRLISEAAAWLARHGVRATAAQAVPVRISFRQLGPGYGVPTAQSLAAVELLRAEGVPGEPVYTGKAFAALLADAAAKRVPKRVLFWHTVRRGPLPHDAGWRDKLPTRLSRRLDGVTRPGIGRRLVIGGGLALGVAAIARVTGYAPLPGWAGQVLSAWEAQVLAAAAEVLSGVSAVEGLTVAANVDRFLVPMAPALKSEVHQLLGLVEHGTALGLRLSRFTALDRDAREAFLLSLGSRGGLLAQAFRGLRDLCLLGAYQDPRAWPELGYAGPWASDLQGPENAVTPYETFRAKPGAAPR